MNEQLNGQATEEQISKWKKEFGNVWEVVIGESVCYLKKASRLTLRAALTFLDKDRIKYMEIIVDNCWLGGDENIKKEDDSFYGLMAVVPELVEAKDAEIKKH